MATIKELLSAMIDKINGNEDKIDNIKGVPEAFDSITMTNGTDMANLTMSAEKELLFNGEAVGGSGGNATIFYFLYEDNYLYKDDGITKVTKDELKNAVLSGSIYGCYFGEEDGFSTPIYVGFESIGGFGYIVLKDTDSEENWEFYTAEYSQE
jgi:hypothetical protein